MESVPYRPLGLIRTTLETLGFEVSHCYEDLVFLNHNAFLLRMEERGENVSVLFNVDSSPAIHEAGKAVNLKFSPSGTYQIIANEDNGTLDIHFNEEVQLS